MANRDELQKKLKAIRTQEDAAFLNRAIAANNKRVGQDNTIPMPSTAREAERYIDLVTGTNQRQLEQAVQNQRGRQTEATRAANRFYRQASQQTAGQTPQQESTASDYVSQVLGISQDRLRKAVTEDFARSDKTFDAYNRDFQTYLVGRAPFEAPQSGGNSVSEQFARMRQQYKDKYHIDYTEWDGGSPTENGLVSAASYPDVESMQAAKREQQATTDALKQMAQRVASLSQPEETDTFPLSIPNLLHSTTATKMFKALYPQEYADFISGNTTNDSEPYIVRLISKAFGAEPEQNDSYKELLYQMMQGEQYASVEKNADFAEKSRYRSTADPNGGSFNFWSGQTVYGESDTLYEYINGNEAIRAQVDAQDIRSNATIAGVDHVYLTYMNARQVGIYNYLYATEGKEKAQQYIDYIAPSLKAMYMQERQAGAAAAAAENPVGASVASVVLSPMKGLSMVGQMVDYAKDGGVDPNEGYNWSTQLPATYRAEVSQIAEDKWGKKGSFLYQTGMSIADNLFQLAITGGSSESAVLAIMGTGAAADGVLAAKNRGLSDDQAMALGVIAGAAEVVTEKVSLDALLGKISFGKSAVARLLTNVIAEGSEEGASDIINLVADVLVSKEQSEWRHSMEAYKRQGYSERDAFWAVFADQAAETGLSILGGAISGGVLGAGSIALRAVTGASSAEQATAEMGEEAYRSVGQYDLIRRGLAIGKNAQNGRQTTAFRLAAQYNKSGKTLDNYELGELYAAVLDAEATAEPAVRYGSEPVDTAMEMIRESGTISNRTADIIAKEQDTETKAAAVRVLQEQTGVEITGDTASEQRAAVKDALMKLYQQERSAETAESDAVEVVESNQVESLPTAIDADQATNPAEAKMLNAPDAANTQEQAHETAQAASAVDTSTIENRHLRNIMDSVLRRGSVSEAAVSAVMKYKDAAQALESMTGKQITGKGRKAQAAYIRSLLSDAAAQIRNGASYSVENGEAVANDTDAAYNEADKNNKTEVKQNEVRSRTEWYAGLDRYGRDRRSEEGWAEADDKRRADRLDYARNQKRTEESAGTRSYQVSILGKAYDTIPAIDDELKQIEQYAAEDGVKVFFLTEPIDIGNGKKASGAHNRNTAEIYINVVNGFSPSELYLHEYVHDLLGTFGKKGTDARNTAVLLALNTIYERVGDDEMLRIVGMYVDEYSKAYKKNETDIVPNPVVYEELICDLVAGMNRYGDVPTYVDEARRVLNQVLAMDLTSAVEKADGGMQSAHTGDGISFSIDQNLKDNLQAIIDHTYDTQNGELYIGETSNFLTDVIGVSSLPVYMSPTKAYMNLVSREYAQQDAQWMRSGKRRALANDPKKNFHNLGVDTMYNALVASETPVVSFADFADSDGNERLNRIVLVTDVKVGDNPIVVIEEIESNARNRYGKVEANKTITVYDKNNIESELRRAARENKILAMDKEKSQTMLGDRPPIWTVAMQESDFADNITDFWGKIKLKDAQNSNGNPVNHGSGAFADAYDRAKRKKSDAKGLGEKRETLIKELDVSLEYDEDFLQNARKKNASTGMLDEKWLDAAEKTRAEIRNIFRDPKMIDALHLPEDRMGNTFYADSSYGGSEENSTVCVRSMAADELMDAIAEYIGHPLTVEDTIQISQEYWKYTDKPECLYCYVAMDRKAYREYLGEYLRQRDAAIEELRSGVDKDTAYSNFLSGRKDTAPMRKRFDTWVRYVQNGTDLISASDLASPARMEDGRQRGGEWAAQIRDAMRYAQSASWAKKRVGYAAYNNHILKWKQSRIDALNRHYGLRMYSFSDFSPAFILENMQQITDAAVRGLNVLAYTKEIDFVKIFAKTGMNINVSVFGYDTADGVSMDAMQGADWEETKRLREQYRNVGATFVATNDKQVQWALDQDWIDVVIPFHLVRTGSKVAASFGWKNYTEMSRDLKDAGWDAKNDALSILPQMHQNDKGKYFAALRQNHLKPRFSEWADHPNYMKLVNETRQSAQETQPVIPDFDVDAAKQSIAEMVKRGGYYQPIGGSRENMLDIAEEIGDKISGSTDSMSYSADAAESSRETDREKVRKILSESIKVYGVIPDGENPVRAADIPAKMTKNSYVSEAARTVYEAGATPDGRIFTIDQILTEGKLQYVPEPLERYKNEAVGIITQKGWQVAVSDFHAAVLAGQSNARTVALGAVLLNNAGNSGMSGEAYIQVLQDYVQICHDTGAALAANRILKTLTPEARLYGIQNAVNELNDRFETAKRVAEGENIEIDPDLLDRFLHAEDDAMRDEILDEIYQNIADQIPPNLMDMFDALRYLNMLGNFKTMGRNVLGNISMWGIKAVKNKVKTGLERMVKLANPDYQKTTAAVFSPAMRKAAMADFENVRDIAMGEPKYSTVRKGVMKEIDDRRTVFKWEVKGHNVLWGFEKARNAVDYGLNNRWFGDEGFIRFNYANELAGYLTANGVSAQNLKDGNVDADLLNAARNYAIKEAQKATFHDDNQVSKLVAGIGTKHTDSKIGRLFNRVVTGVMPFRKTPANVLVRAIEYSPAGFVMAVHDAVQMRKGAEVTGSDIIDHIASAVTGSALMAIGFVLARAGIAVGSGDDDEEQAAFDKLIGHQTYSIEVGGKSFTIDWLTPTSMPFFVGVEAFRTWEDRGDLEPDDVIQALLSIGNPLLEMSMMSGVSNLLDDLSYSDNRLVTLTLDALFGYYEQGIGSTLVGQINRSMYKNRKTTMVQDETWSEHLLPDGLQYELASLESRTLVGTIDYLLRKKTYAQIDYVDAWGSMDEYNTAWQVPQQFLLPGYGATLSTDEVNDALQKLYDEMQAEGIEGTPFPERPEKTISWKTEDSETGASVAHEVELTGEQYVLLATAAGQMKHQIVSELLSNETWSKMTTEQKLDAITTAYGYATDTAKQLVSDYVPQSGVNTDIADAEAAGVSASTFISFKELEDELKPDTDADGNDIDGSQRLKQLAFLNSMNIPDSEKLCLYIYDIASNARVEKVQTLMQDANLSWRQVSDVLTEFDTLTGQDLRPVDRATAFAKWSDEHFEDKQSDVVKQVMRFTQVMYVDAETYEKYAAAGLAPQDAANVQDALTNLTPEEGKENVTKRQRTDAILKLGMSDEDTANAISALEGEEDGPMRRVIDSGVKDDTVVKVARALNDLKPDADHEQVTIGQKFLAVANLGISESEKMKAITAIDSGTKAASLKIGIADDYGVLVSDYVNFMYKNRYRYDADGNGNFTQAEATAAVNSMSGYGTAAKAALWQLICTGTKGKSNPFSVDVGNAVRRAMGKEE